MSSSANIVPLSSRLQPRSMHPTQYLQARLAARGAMFRYQPQFDMRSGRIAGVESMLSVPGLQGYRPAPELIQEIVEIDLGPALVECQLRDACRAQRGWLQRFAHDFPVGVPVSQRALSSPALLPMAIHLLADNGLEPASLELEIEETAMGSSAAALHSLAGLRDSGMSIAIDGFNAAHVNLRLLAMLPASKLRVDAFPLLKTGAGAAEQRVFHGIVGAARALGLVVCATSVNSPAILAAVLRHGRPLAQGTEVGCALSSSAFLELLRDRNESTATLAPLAPQDFQGKLSPPAIRTAGAAAPGAAIRP
jgi:EAL domain-containing protein (putative c-di-GMP-specific phosphodiesterase class I)